MVGRRRGTGVVDLVTFLSVLLVLSTPFTTLFPLCLLVVFEVVVTVLSVTGPSSSLITDNDFGNLSRGVPSTAMTDSDTNPVDVVVSSSSSEQFVVSSSSSEGPLLEEKLAILSLFRDSGDKHVGDRTTLSEYDNGVVHTDIDAVSVLLSLLILPATYPPPDRVRLVLVLVLVLLRR